MDRDGGRDGDRDWDGDRDGGRDCICLLKTILLHKRFPKSVAWYV